MEARIPYHDTYPSYTPGTTLSACCSTATRWTSSMRRRTTRSRPSTTWPPDRATSKQRRQTVAAQPDRGRHAELRARRRDQLHHGAGTITPPIEGRLQFAPPQSRMWPLRTSAVCGWRQHCSHCKLDGFLTLTNVQYGNSTAYIDVPAGPHLVEIYPAGSATVAISAKVV